MASFLGPMDCLDHVVTSHFLKIPSYVIARTVVQSLMVSTVAVPSYETIETAVFSARMDILSNSWPSNDIYEVWKHESLDGARAFHKALVDQILVRHGQYVDSRWPFEDSPTLSWMRKEAQADG